MSLVDSFVEVLLPDHDAFLKVKETLTRIGVPSSREKKLYQSCHILHKRGRYYVVHFKQMFALDGRRADISEEDLLRLDTVASLLAAWGLLSVVEPEKLRPPSPSTIKVLTFREKEDWKLIPKYAIGKRVAG